MTKMLSILTTDPGSSTIKVKYDQSVYFEIDIVCYVFKGADEENDIHFDPRPRFESR